MATKSIQAFVASCLADKGDHEEPLGSNNTKYGRKFGFNRVAWCVIYGWCKYTAAGVVWPVKTASCVVIYDACVKRGLRYDGRRGKVGDAVIRTWQHLHRDSPGFDPEQTHFQEVLEVKRIRLRKYLGLWGGNQGAGYVGPDIEWVPANDPSILGALAFHRLFDAPAQPSEKHSKQRDMTAGMPAAKSHKYPSAAPAKPHRTHKCRRWHWHW